MAEWWQQPILQAHSLWASVVGESDSAASWASSALCFCSVFYLPHEFCSISLWLVCKFDSSVFLKVFHKFIEVHNILEEIYPLSTKICRTDFALLQTICRCLSIFVLHLSVIVPEFAKFKTQERDYYVMKSIFKRDYIFQHFLPESVSIALYDIQTYWLTCQSS